MCKKVHLKSTLHELTAAHPWTQDFLAFVRAVVQVRLLTQRDKCSQEPVQKCRNFNADKRKIVSFFFLPATPLCWNYDSRRWRWTLLAFAFRSNETRGQVNAHDMLLVACSTGGNGHNNKVSVGLTSHKGSIWQLQHCGNMAVLPRPKNNSLSFVLSC